MKLNSLLLSVTLTVCATVSAPVRAEMITLGSSNDTWIRDGVSHTANGVSTALNSLSQFVPYIQFDMSSLDIDAVSSATLRVWKVAGSRNDAINVDRFATYGLPDAPGNTLQNWHELNDFDPLDTTNGLDFRNVGDEWVNDAASNGVVRSNLVSLDPQDGTPDVIEAVNGTTGEVTVTGAALVAFLNARADANGLVTFLFPVEATSRGYGIASKENATESLRPTLTLEYTIAVPEPATCVLLTLGTLGLLAARRK